MPINGILFKTLYRLKATDLKLTDQLLSSLTNDELLINSIDYIKLKKIKPEIELYDDFEATLPKDHIVTVTLHNYCIQIDGDKKARTLYSKNFEEKEFFTLTDYRQLFY